MSRTPIRGRRCRDAWRSSRKPSRAGFARAFAGHGCCGVFGNISDDDVERLVRAAPQLCAAGATVIWTRSRRSPDLTPSIRQWFAEAEFEERSFTAPDGDLFTVGVLAFHGEPQPLTPGVRLFSFER